MAKMSENSAKVLEYLKSLNGADVTAADVAKALGFEKKSSVDAIFTGFARKVPALGYREEVEVVDEAGATAKVKFLKLTAEGMAYVDED